MKRRLIDILQDNAGKISLGLAGLTAVGVYLFKPDYNPGYNPDYLLGEVEYKTLELKLVHKFMDIISSKELTIVYYSIVPLLVYPILKTLRKLKEPVFTNAFNLIFDAPIFLFLGALFKATKNYNGLINLLENQRRYFGIETWIDLQIGSIHFKKGDIEGGIEYFKKAFENLSRVELSLVEKIILLNLRQKSLLELKEKPKDTEPYFDLIDLGLRENNFKESVEYWDKLSDLDIKERIDINVLHALFLDSLEKNKERLAKAGKYLENISSIKQWEKAIKLILEEQDLEKRFEKIADSRNEVLEYGPSKFLKNTFVFKRAVKGDELRGDYLTNLFLYELNRKSNEGLKLAKPLKFLSSFKKYSYAITQRKPLKNLEDAFESVSDEEKEIMLKRGLMNTRLMHDLSTLGLYFNEEPYFYVEEEGQKIKVAAKRYDYAANLERRLIKRLGKNSQGGELISAVDEGLVPYKNRFLRLINGDLALPNILEDGTIIDFEKMALGNPVLDAVTTLEDPKNGSLDRRKLFGENYLDNLKGWENEYLEESYLPHAVFISACQVGSKIEQGRKALENGKLEKANAHVNRAKGFARQVLEKGSPKVKNKFAEYIRSSEVKELQEVL